MKAELQSFSIYFWILIGILLFIQGSWIFLDARKHSRYPWFWGIWGMTSIPTPIICYLIVQGNRRRKEAKRHE